MPSTIAEWLDDHPDNFHGARAAGDKRCRRERSGDDSLELAEQIAQSCSPTMSGAGNGYALLARAHRELDDAKAERKALEALGAAQRRCARRLRTAGRAGRTKRAIGTAVALNAQRMLAVNPLTPAPHRWLAQAAEKLGRRRRDCRVPGAAWSSTRPIPVDAHYRLAVLAARAAGDDDDARRHVLMALEDAPRFLDAHRLLLTLIDDLPANCGCRSVDAWRQPQMTATPSSPRKSARRHRRGRGDRRRRVRPVRRRPPRSRPRRLRRRPPRRARCGRTTSSSRTTCSPSSASCTASGG